MALSTLRQETQVPQASSPGFSQLSAAASARATVRLPTASGPWKSSEWCRRPSASDRLSTRRLWPCPAMWSSGMSMASLRQFQGARHHALDLFRDLLDGLIRRDDLDARALGRGDGEITLAYALVEHEILLFEAGGGRRRVCLVALAGAPQTHLHRQVQQDREVGLQIHRHQGVDHLHLVERDLAAVALVGHRGV